MVTLVGIVTIAGSTYMIIYSDKLFKFVGKSLSFLEFRKTLKSKTHGDKNYKAIIFGYRRAGPEFAHAFKESNTKFLAIDFNPDTIPDFEPNLLLSQTVRRINKEAVIIIITDTMEHAIELYAAGVTNVVLSHYIGARYAANMIMELGLDVKKYEQINEDHIKYLTGLKGFLFQK